jgi:hypothetical protein
MISLLRFNGSKIEHDGRAAGDSVIGISESSAGRDYDSEVYATHGIVSRPCKKTFSLALRLGGRLFSFASYTYGVTPPANEGACKLYSTDIDGVEQSSILLDNDGMVTINEGTDFAVRYSALETAFNQLKSDFDTFASTHTHTGVSSGTSSSGTAIAIPSTADISGAKVEEIKLP